MNTHRILIASALLFAALAAPTFAQTQPPGGGTRLVPICVYDSNEGAVYIRYRQPDQATVDRGVATEGHPTLANEQNRCDQPEPTPVPQAPTATATPAVPAEVVQATPTATVVVATATATPEVPATDQPTATPTSTPTARPTREPLVEPTPTLAPGEPEPIDIEPCYPGGPVPCGEGGKV